MGNAGGLNGETGKGAAVFMNSDSSRVATPKRLNNKMIESIILLYKSPG